MSARYRILGLLAFLLGLFSGMACMSTSPQGIVEPANGQPTRQSTLSALTGAKPDIAASPTPEPQPTDPLFVAPDLLDLSLYLPTPTPDKLPDYPIPTPSLVPRKPGLTDSSPAVRIRIPKLGLDTVVKYVPFSGQSWLIGGLKQEVAWMGDTSWPGLGDNTALAGHVDLYDGSDGPFRYLYDLEPGDEVIVYTEQYAYHYQVRRELVVPDTDLSILEQTTEPQLTLITCTGWDSELRAYLQRLVIYADLIKTESLN